MKKATTMRYKEYIREACNEYQRRGYFIRIYPAKQSDIYDQYFSSARPYNKVLYKAFFTDEILRSNISSTNRPEIKMKMDLPQSAYEQYKKQQQDKAALKKEEEMRNVKRTQGNRPITGGTHNSGKKDSTDASAANSNSQQSKDNAGATQST